MCVQGLSWMELTFFITAFMMLYTGFVTKAVLMTHPCFSYGWAVPAQHQCLLHFSGCPHSKLVGCKGKLRGDTVRTADPSCSSHLTSYAEKKTWGEGGFGKVPIHRDRLGISPLVRGVEGLPSHLFCLFVGWLVCFGCFLGGWLFFRGVFFFVVVLFFLSSSSLLHLSNCLDLDPWLFLLVPLGQERAGEQLCGASLAGQLGFSPLQFGVPHLKFWGLFVFRPRRMKHIAKIQGQDNYFMNSS